MSDYRQYYVAAYRAYNGNVIPIGNEFLNRQYAEREVVGLSSADDETPIFVATRRVPYWEEDDD